MAEILKVVKKEDAQRLQSLQSAYRVADNRERGWNGDVVFAMKGDFNEAYQKMGLKWEEAEMLCWYVWALEGNDEVLPEIIDMRIVKADYEHTHRQYVT